MPERTKGEYQAQDEILDHVLKGLCPAELNSDGRTFIEKLRIRIQKQISNETERLKGETGNDNDYQHSDGNR